MCGLFVFYVVNVFLGNVLIGSVFSALKQITSDPTSIVSLLATTIPGTSRFFIAFVALKAGALVASTSVLIANVVYRLMRLLSGPRNARNEALAWQPKQLSLAVHAADSACARSGRCTDTSRALPLSPTRRPPPPDKTLITVLLVWLLVLIFTTLAPIMYGAGFFYFGARLFEAKTEVLYRHEPLYESAARWWPALRHRVVFSLYCAQLTLVLVVALKTAAGPAVLTAALVPITAAASACMRVRYDSFAPHVPQPLQQYVGVERATDAAPLKEAYLPTLGAGREMLLPADGPLRDELAFELRCAGGGEEAAVLEREKKGARGGGGAGGGVADEEAGLVAPPAPVGAHERAAAEV